MAEVATLQPITVEYCSVTGVPAEFNDFLPKDSEEHKKWQAFKQAELEGKTADLSIKEGKEQEVEKPLPGGKKAKKAKQEVVIARNVRNKKKCVTTVTGLETFKIKLPEAAKIFGKKFACGASVTKTPAGGEEIDIQGDVLETLPDLLMKTYADKGLAKKHVYTIDDKKKKVPFYDSESEEE